MFLNILVLSIQQGMLPNPGMPQIILRKPFLARPQAVSVIRLRELSTAGLINGRKWDQIRGEVVYIGLNERI